MYYYGARYYDPRISIFVSVDPLAEQTMEPYSYVGNNPIMFTDPTGMSKQQSGDPKKVKQLQDKYRQMVADARKVNKNFVANNLEHFLNATGSNRNLNPQFLRNFSKIDDAEKEFWDMLKIIIYQNG